MGSEAQPIHMLFFPFMAAGHIIPMADLARLFSSHGVKATILTTPANVSIIQPTIDRASISLVVVPFPSAAVGLPAGCENVSSVPSVDLKLNFQRGVDMLRQPFDQVLTDLLPDCVVTDYFLPWTLDVATEHDIPRLVFDGTGFFPRCAVDAIERYNILDTFPAEAEALVLPGLPHRIEMLRSQILNPRKNGPVFEDFFKKAKESVNASYGVVVNSFLELEPDYVRHYREVIGRRAWHVGPVSLCNKDELEQSGRGDKSSIDCEAILQWLGSKKPGSVVYMCFGSLGEFTLQQVREIALGLESSDHPFIWVVRKEAEWLPDGYEERIGGRGLVIKGWAPQILILNHPAVGGFVTHCGWNSTLEGVTAGVAMGTWPLFAEQFYNERLIVDVLGIGVAVGVKECIMWPEKRTLVTAAEVERAVGKLMDTGEEAEGRKMRARELKEKAKVAVEEGGSSFADIENLITEMRTQRTRIQTVTDEATVSDEQLESLKTGSKRSRKAPCMDG